MSRFVVFEPGADSGEPSAGARFVRDGFAGWAVLFPFLWLFRHGLVVSGLAALALWVGFGFLAEIPGLRPAATVLPILLGLLVALEGPTVRAARLRRKRYREVAVVEADSEDEAAILYYAGAESNSVSRESLADSRETPVAAYAGRASVAARNLLDPPRTIP